MVCVRCVWTSRWTWTGHDYRGEPTPDSWPDVNSHFGIVDAAGFPKDRFYWYQNWFIPETHNLYLFPHWKYVQGRRAAAVLFPLLVVAAASPLVSRLLLIVNCTGCWLGAAGLMATR